MSEEPKDIRVPIMMSASGLQAVDDWMFENRIRSRGEAIRILIELGLEISAQNREREGAQPSLLLTASRPPKSKPWPQEVHQGVSVAKLQSGKGSGKPAYATPAKTPGSGPARSKPTPPKR